MIMLKGLCNFLLVINSNLGPISLHFEIRPVFGCEMHIFLPFFHSVLDLKMFPFALISRNFAGTEPPHQANYL